MDEKWLDALYEIRDDLHILEGRLNSLLFTMSALQMRAAEHGMKRNGGETPLPETGTSEKTSTDK